MSRSILILLALCLSLGHSKISLRRLSYMKFPYEYVNNDPINSKYGMFQKAAYKAAYHTVDRILYVISSHENFKYIHLIDMNQPDKPVLLLTHTAGNAFDGFISNVAACSDTIAVTLVNHVHTDNGHVEYYTPYNRADQKFERTGRNIVGHYPKDLAFTSNCQKLVVVNEGIPGLNGPSDSPSSVFLDPDPSVFVITRNNQGFPTEQQIGFSHFDQNFVDYVSRGVRYVFRGDHTQGIVNTFSQDLEPESVTISNDDRYAFVSLQENNAVAKLDLNVGNFVDLYPLGVKNWTLYNIDASDANGAAHLRRHQIYSFYQPGDLGYGVINGKGYLISADTGKVKTLTSQVNAYDFSDAVRCRTAAQDGTLDQSTIPSTLWAQLTDDQQLGRAFMSTEDGRNIFGSIDKVHLFGGRGISMWDPTTMVHVFDSGDDMENQNQISYPSTFNGDCSNINLTPVQENDKRSDDMGPEPSALGVGTFNSTSVMIVGTRTGLLYVYSMRGASAIFESVHREGGTSNTWSNLYNNDQAGDVMISDVGFIEGRDSSTGNPLVYVIGHGTGSLSIYELVQQ